MQRDVSLGCMPVEPECVNDEQLTRCLFPTVQEMPTCSLLDTRTAITYCTAESVCVWVGGAALARGRQATTRMERLGNAGMCE